jgi:hypothetical protein
LIDVSVPLGRNVIQNEAENKLKYKSLSIKIHRMWNKKSFIIPVIIGAMGIIIEVLNRYLETIPGKHSINFVQKK